ncbi:hypothetical protein ACA895_000759 [Vibrio vulnificus]|uniref:hypothetical protein n=1 Tax=Vibrio vulnificus TaxID=672 RepID=UPI002879D834|nr:hypothetical protein [Vibrio vulnificus]MDS1847487.1 hypothetical protein [Vibrio vulnificus]
MVGGLTDQTQAKMPYRHYYRIAIKVNDQAKRPSPLRVRFNDLEQCRWEMYLGKSAHAT